MSKVRNPLLSFSATGTIAESLTFTRSPAGPRAQAIPTHPDARTLPQSYQRWKFRDAQFAWNALAPSQKAAYNAARYPPHMSGQQRHTRQYLRALTDLAFWLPLDEPTGQSLRDISRNANHATATGTATALGIIDQARLFDGTDDRLTIPHSPSLNTGIGDFSLLCWIRTTSTCALHSKLHFAPLRGYWAYIFGAPTNGLRLYIGDGVYRNYIIPWLTTPFDSHWHHFAAVLAFANLLYFYLDGALQGTADISLTSNSIDNPADFVFSDTGPRLTGHADDIRFYARALTPAHIAYIYSQERFPLPP